MKQWELFFSQVGGTNRRSVADMGAETIVFGQSGYSSCLTGTLETCFLIQQFLVYLTRAYSKIVILSPTKVQQQAASILDMFGPQEKKTVFIIDCTAVVEERCLFFFPVQ